ncbi:MAG: EamA family transporter RarD, partial [Phycisphaerales bacterium]|nr:EamA family transporter RarD [Phycisphaerales bacterium]
MTRPREADGVIYGLTAYLLWGFAPLYFKLFTGVSPVEVLAHRVIWSV